MNRKTRILVLVLAVSLCYVNTARNAFIWDDAQYITSNEQILSLRSASSLLIPSANEPYRPLRLLSFAVEHSLFGFNPAMYHLDNVAIHLANVLLLFAVLLLILKDEELAFYSALIFGIYPAWNEAIVWVKNRSMLMAGFFMLLGLYFYIKRKNPLAMAAFVLGLLSKEILIAFPAIVTAYAYIFDKERNKTDLVSFWVVGVAWTLFLFIVYNGQAGGYSPGAGLFFSLKIMFRFLLILLFPFRLNAEREVAFPDSIFDAEVVVSFIITVLVLAWLYRDRFRHKTLAFLTLWMVFNIFPTANPGVVAGRPLAEHRLYIVGAGFSVLLAMGLRKKKVLLYSLLPVFFVTSFMRNLDWKDGLSFWSQTARVSPDSVRANTNLALSYNDAGDTARAEEYFMKVMRTGNGYPLATRGYAQLLIKKGEKKEAEALLEQSLKKYPAEINVYKDLVDLYILQKKEKEAGELCAKAASLIDVSPGNLEDYMPIGLLAFRFGQLESAENIFSKIFAAKPWSGYVANNLASVYQAENKYPEAEKYYKLAMKNQPSNPFYYYNVGNLYYNIGEKNKAAASYKKAISFAEEYADAWYNLGYVSEEIGDFKEAERCYKKLKALGVYKKPLPSDKKGRLGRV